MTDHTDLITRLRKSYEHGDSNNCLEAADALEALQAEHTDEVMRGLMLEKAHAMGLAERDAALAQLAESDKQHPAKPQGCACRWDADDNRIATCTRHQGWLDVVQEWADRAKVAEAKLAQPPAPSDAAIPYMTGYSDVREWAMASRWNCRETPNT